MFACGGGNICYNNVMNRVVNFLQKYFAVISVLIGISILLSISFSNFIVTSNNHKAAEMYIGELKYSIEIDGTTTNTLTVPTGETIIDVKVNNLNPVDTYYKLLYLKNTNITVKYYESTKDTDDVVTTYNKPNDSVTSSNSNTIKLLITNNSTSSQNIALTMKGGYITNTVEDIATPSTYSEITLVDTSTNTYFCKTNDTLKQGLKYVNGQYTYAYKQKGNYVSSTSTTLGWSYISLDGWGVQLTDKSSTDAVISRVCTYINNKPIVSMSTMFLHSQATSLDISNFNTSNVIYMDSMFWYSQATTLDVSNFDTSNVTTMYYMFSDSKATVLDVSNFDISNVTNMSGMFASCKAITLDVSNFDTSKVTNMAHMFHKSQATTLDVSNFDTSKVTNMNGMFGSTVATKIDVSNFDTSNVTTMTQMFLNTQATALDVSNFDTSKVTDMSSMFNSSQATTLDVSNFDTSKVTDMSSMFSYSQATTLDVSNFDTSKVTNMLAMFYKSQATTLDVSNFDTSKVTNMSIMFYGTKATTLNISNFDTSNVTDMSSMFKYNNNLKTIYVSDKFNTNNVTNSSNMFDDCTNLVGGAGTKYNSSYVDKTYARIDGGTSNPGYFTDIADKDIPAPVSFSTDSWKTIIKAVRSNNISKYSVGDTKTIDVGNYGSHTIRIANTTTPSACSTSGFSQSACGFVIEFVDSVTNSYMSGSMGVGTNTGGWPASVAYTTLNTNLYNALPTDLQAGIINTTVVSGHGSNDSSNFTSTDKLYLLSPKEIYTDFNITYDTAKDLTRTLDYYTNKGVTTSNYSGAIKKSGSSSVWWWLRTASNNSSNSTTSFYCVYSGGNPVITNAMNSYGISPAFRIG